MFILTFDLPELPEKLHAGFLSLNVQLYIPNPRRCFNCQEFGHGAKFCKNPEICSNCADIQHDPKPEVCKKPLKCKNCSGLHATWDKRCPVFVKEKTIQQIQTVNRISNYQARQRLAESEKLTPSPQVTSYTEALIHTNSHSLSHTQAKNTPIPSKKSTKSSNPNYSPDSIHESTPPTIIKQSTGNESAHSTNSGKNIVNQINNTTDTTIHTSDNHNKFTNTCLQHRENNINHSDITDLDAERTQTTDNTKFTTDKKDSNSPIPMQYIWPDEPEQMTTE